MGTSSSILLENPTENGVLEINLFSSLLRGQKYDIKFNLQGHNMLTNQYQ